MRGDRGARSVRRLASTLCVVAVLIACGRGPQSPPRGASDLTGSRLAAIHPQVYLRGGEALFFLCRWSTEAPLPVSIPADATREELAAISQVLRALEGAGLGLRFVTIEGARTAITLELYDNPVATPTGPDAGNTVSDCRIGEDPVPEQAEVVEAELVAATLRIARRTGPNWRGTPRPLSPAETRGVLLHEFGQALGCSGHARRGPTVMVRDLDAVRRRGAALLAGEPFRDAALEALYARPNGLILRREAIDPWRSDGVDRMTALAAAGRLEGPFLRTGETRARIYWSDRQGTQYGLLLVNLIETLRDPNRALIAPEARTRRALPRSRDLRP